MKHDTGVEKQNVQREKLQVVLNMMILNRCFHMHICIRLTESVEKVWHGRQVYRSISRKHHLTLCRHTEVYTMELLRLVVSLNLISWNVERKGISEV